MNKFIKVNVDFMPQAMGELHQLAFTAKIDGMLCHGVIYATDDKMWLCQDLADGSSAPCKYGYRYSWVINKSEIMLEEMYIHKGADVKDLHIYSDLFNIMEAKKGFMDRIDKSNADDLVGWYTYTVTGSTAFTSIDWR